MPRNEHKKVLQRLSEAYSQVHEGHSGPVPDWEEQAGLKDELEANRKAARQDVDHISEAIKEMIKTFLDDDEFEGGLQDAFDLTIEQIGDSLGYYTIDNIGFEDAEEFDGPGMQWDGIDDPLPGSLGPKVTPTHKPYVSSYTSNDGKKVFDVLDSNGQPVFRTHSKLEAHKWFKTNYENL